MLKDAVNLATSLCFIQKDISERGENKNMKGGDAKKVPLLNKTWRKTENITLNSALAFSKPSTRGLEKTPANRDSFYVPDLS